MILITGAAGKTGRAIIRALAARGEAVRALVRRDAQVGIVKSEGAREAHVGSLDDIVALTEAARGVRAIYHIAPNVSSNEAAFGDAMIAAARAGGVARVVYHSVLRPAIEAMPHHWAKLRVEERLFASGLDVTVLQPAPYMQNILAGWRRIAEEGVYRVPYSVDARLSLVDLDDVGDAAALVLTEDGYAHAAYEIVGTKPLSGVDVAQTLERVLGRSVRAEAEAPDVWAAGPGAALTPYACETLLAMFRYYDRHGLAGNPQVLRGLLGRPPRTLEEFAAREAGVGRQARPPC